MNALIQRVHAEARGRHSALLGPSPLDAFQIELAAIRVQPPATHIHLERREVAGEVAGEAQHFGRAPPEPRCVKLNVCCEQNSWMHVGPAEPPLTPPLQQRLARCCNSCGTLPTHTLIT